MLASFSVCIAPAPSPEESVLASARSAIGQTVPPREVIVPEGHPDACDELAAAGLPFVTVSCMGELARCCTGEWLAVVGAGDELLPDALESAGKLLANAPDSLLLAYGDEELGASGGAVMLKPAWSPTFMRYFDYVGRTWIANKKLLRQLPHDAGSNSLRSFRWFAGHLAPGQCVGHLSEVLARSHRRVDAGVAPADDEAGTVNPKALPGVSVVIPTRIANESMLRNCLDGLLHRTDYARTEVIVVLNGGAARPDWMSDRVRVIDWSGPFNWAAVNNAAAACAGGDLLLFLNDDIEIAEPGWLWKLVRLQMKTGAGVIGPLLTYADGLTQHAGMRLVYHGGGTEHLFHRSVPGTGAAAWLASYPREVAAVTGAAMLVAKSLFDSLGGFDERFSLVCNDTDFCLRAALARASVLIEPRSRLFHHEKASRDGLDEMPDTLRFWARWESELRKGDAYAHPNLQLGSSEWLEERNPALRRRMLRIN
jgi:GT2 family glycosyltransferase